jgi:hypothetical protein
MGVINIISRKIEAGTHGRVGVTTGDWGQLRADMSFVSSFNADRGVVGSVTVWRQDGTRFPLQPDEDVLIRRPARTPPTASSPART